MNCHPLAISLVAWLALAAHLPAAEEPRPELVIQSGHASPVNTVSFSPDGRLLASGSGEHWSIVERNVVKLWDVDSGAELRTFAHTAPVDWLGFSADGQTLAARCTTGITPGKIRAWNVTTGAELPDPPADFQSTAKVTRAGATLVAHIDGKNIQLRDAASGKSLRTLASRTSDFQKAKFSPDEMTLACGGERFSIRMWDLRSGVLHTLQGHTDFPVAADFSNDSRLFASGGRDLVVRLWDVASGRQIKTFAGHQGKSIRGVHFSPRGKSLLTFDHAGLKLWDIASGRELVSEPGDHDDDYARVIFSPQGDLLAAATPQGVKLWTADTGELVRAFPNSTTHGALAFSSDGKYLLSDTRTSVDVWEVAAGRHIAHILPTHTGESKYDVDFPDSAFSADGRLLAVSEHDSSGNCRWCLRVYETDSGKLLRTVEANSNSLNPGGSLHFSPDGKRILVEGDPQGVAWNIASSEPAEPFVPDKPLQRGLSRRYSYSFGNGGEMILHDAKTFEPIASLIGVDETDWLVSTAEGFFDGSPTAWKQIYWHFNNDTFNRLPLEAFFNEFYHPGLLQDVLHGNRPTPPAGQNLSSVDRRQPRVAVVQMHAPASADAPLTERQVTVAVDVMEATEPAAQQSHPAASGARDVRLFRNGSLVKAWRGDVFSLGPDDGCTQFAPTANRPGRGVRCQVTVPVVPGSNEFTAYAFNHANIKSTDATLALTGDESLRRPATLHMLAIGVDRYSDKQLNLRYAVADARAFFVEIGNQQRMLNEVQRVEGMLINDSQATRECVLAAIDALAKAAQPQDTVVIYFAGHGIASGNSFFLVPHDVGQLDTSRTREECLSALTQRSISDRDLERALSDVDAAQIVLVVDACNSGQLLEAEEKRRGPMNSKGLAQLAYEKGMYVLTASQSFETAVEDSRLGHGLLTYVLVEEGLQQAAADELPGDGRIELREWLDYATTRVPRVALRDSALRLGIPVEPRQRPRVFYRPDARGDNLLVARRGTSTQLFAEQSRHDAELATLVGAKPVAIALADRTMADQPLSETLQKTWQRKLAEVARNPKVKLTDVASAEWLVQVAALEESDIIYLVPVSAAGSASDDGPLRMSPAGYSAAAWLADELARLAEPLPAIPDDGQNQKLAVADRAILGMFRKGSAEDLKAEIVLEQSALYHTPNRTQAVLGSYGKVVEGNKLVGRLPRFEHRGLVRDLNRVRRFTTVHREGQTSGQDFVSLVGSRQAWQVVDLSGQVSASRQNNVTFEIVGVRLDQNDVLKAINTDPDALAYFDYLAKNNESPCLVLENLVLASYAASQGTNLQLGAGAKTTLTADAAAGRLNTQRTAFTRFASPVVRCYQMYAVKLNQNRAVELVAIEP